MSARADKGTARGRAALLDERVYFAGRLAARVGAWESALGVRPADGAILLPDPQPGELAVLSQAFGRPVRAGPRGTLVVDGRTLNARDVREARI